MLDVNPDNVCRLVELAREFHAKESVVLPDDASHSLDELPLDVLENHEGDLVLEEFRAIVADLEPSQQQEVVALLWLGREDGTFEEWDSLLEIARDEWTPNTADYLIGHPMLADFLAEGLAMHGHTCEGSDLV